MTIYITETPIKPMHGDYDILIGYGIDNKRNCYELVFTNENGKAGRLEGAMNVFTGIHIDPSSVNLKKYKEANDYGEETI